MGKITRFDYDVAAVGTVRTPSYGYLAAAVEIDNPSDMWLYVQPISRYVPPQTLGWVGIIEPSSRNIRINYVNAPTGGVASAATGGPIVVIVHETPIASSNGADYGLDNNILSLITSMGTLNTSIIVLQSLIQELNLGSSALATGKYLTAYYGNQGLTGTPLLGTIVAGVGGVEYFVTRIFAQVGGYVNDPLPSGASDPSAALPFWLELWDSAFSQQFFGMWNSGEQPMDMSFAPGAMGLGVGQGIALNLDATQEAASGPKPFYSVLIEYYTSP